ncbi:MAG: hypothetical protein WCT28_03660 [Patescibacteria group bacterium]|jgi:hypothetical protein
MSLYKQTTDLLLKGRDKIVARLFNESYVPVGLSDLNHYFRIYGAIHFHHEKQEDGSVVAISNNFRYGTIITHAQRLEELDEKVKDAILTAFEVPSSYAKEAGIRRTDEKEYAFA